jgi:hypothetical protein
MALTTTRLLLAAGLLGLTSMAAMAQTAKPDQKPAESRTLKVKMNYTGAGKVDEKHRIFVFVFDSPAFMQGMAMPVGSGAATAKDGTVTVPNISASPVYVVAAFDPTGNYDGQSGPPPSGSPMGMYAKTPGAPEPVAIDPGKTVEITLAFDDSFKMP